MLPRVDLGDAAVEGIAEQDRHEALAVASPCAGDDADEAGLMPQGLLEDVIQYRAFLDAVAAPPAATRRGRRRG